MKTMKLAIHWFRRDLRLHDNTALAAAVATADEVVPVFIASEWRGSHDWTGAPRQEALCGALRALAKNITRAGGRLIIRRGRADEEIEKLIRETQAAAIFFNRDPDPFGRAMEENVRFVAEQCGCAVHPHKDVAIHERDEVLTAGGTPFRVFTAYARAWRKIPMSSQNPRVERLRTPVRVKSLALPELDWWGLCADAKIIAAGEDAARQRLEKFFQSPIFHYAEKRDLPAEQGTSRLSGDLRLGTLSPREIFSRAEDLKREATQAARKNISTFQNELIWREFYMQVLWHWPEVLETDFKPKFRMIRWRQSPEALARWCSAETGFPIVDAAMRQLLATGFMHNRLRMIVAMFLTKDLQIYWKAGERFFMQRLIDGEIASNNGGWQWSAGTGADAAPYFRVQNPWRQTARFDPRGEFIKRWLPELRDVPPKKFTHPPTEGKGLVRGYPAPMADHAQERERALEMFRISSPKAAADTSGKASNKR